MILESIIIGAFLFAGLRSIAKCIVAAAKVRMGKNYQIVGVDEDTP